MEYSNEVAFSGELITDHGTFPLQRKINVIKNFHSPTTKTELRSFLGMETQFIHYYPDLSQTSKQLRELLKKSNRLRCEKLDENQFQKAG